MRLSAGAPTMPWAGGLFRGRPRPARDDSLRSPWHHAEFHANADMAPMAPLGSAGLSRAGAVGGEVIEKQMLMQAEE